jgi:acetolactate synthase-1/2/3 large subunit
MASLRFTAKRALAKVGEARAGPEETAAMTRMTGGEALVLALVAQGADTLFVLPGVQNDPLFSALYDAAGQLRVIVTRHEQGAAYMAHGYAAATGRPGVYCVVPGPGFLNTTAALATAYGASLPVLCLSGQIPSRWIGRGAGLLHEIPDQLGIMQRLTKFAARIDAPEDAGDLVAEAFAKMRRGRPRPAALEMPMDVMAREGWVASAPGAAPPVVHPEPDPDALERAAGLLNRAARPMIFAGGGAHGASPEVRELAERLCAPVVAGWMGLGVMDGGSELCLNITAAHRLWPEVDVALAVGSRFQRVQMDWGVDQDLKVIRIDLDPTEISRHAQPEVALLADAGAALRALLPAIRSDRRPAWRARVASVKAEVGALLRRELAPQYELIDALRAALPEDGILVEDLTQIGYVARLAFPVHGPRQYLSSSYQGTLGFSYPAALGAKVALPERAVVAIAGDGGFMYNVQELATAAQYGINVVAVVFNDRAYGNVKRIQRELYGNRVIASDLTNPDFVRLGASFSLFAERATSPDELHAALEHALARNEPALIEVPLGELPGPWPYIHMPRVRG